jgi:MFS family permease
VTAAREDPAGGAATEWRAHWGLVFAAWLATSFVAVPSLSLGLFIEPLEQSFGWGRAEVALGLAIYAVVGTPLAPFAGALADRFGARAVAIPGLLLNSLAFAAFGLLFGAFWLWIALWIAYTLTQLTIRSMVWNRAVSGAFSASRGLALALLMSGSSFGQFATPIVTQWLIGQFGWRVAYAALGLGWGGIALLAALLLLREPGARAVRSEQVAAAEPGGLTLAQALRDARIVRLGLAILVNSTLIMGLTVHLFPLLTGGGVSRPDAAAFVSLLGVAALAGQLSTGWLADRIDGSLLALLCFVVPGLAYLVFLLGGTMPATLLGGVLLAGFGSSATLTITIYLATRYAGVRHFGKVAGVLSSCMGFGAGVGPLIAGHVFDATQSYDLFLAIAVAGAVLNCGLVFRLGPYPDFASRAPAAS